VGNCATTFVLCKTVRRPGAGRRRARLPSRRECACDRDGLRRPSVGNWRHSGRRSAARPASAFPPGSVYFTGSFRLAELERAGLAVRHPVEYAISIGTPPRASGEIGERFAQRECRRHALSVAWRRIVRAKAIGARAWRRGPVVRRPATLGASARRQAMGHLTGGRPRSRLGSHSEDVGCYQRRTKTSWTDSSATLRGKDPDGGGDRFNRGDVVLGCLLDLAQRVCLSPETRSAAKSRRGLFSDSARAPLANLGESATAARIVGGRTTQSASRGRARPARTQPRATWSIR